MEAGAVSEASNLQGSESKRMMLQDKPKVLMAELQSVIRSLIVDKCPVIKFLNQQGTGPPMVKAGGPLKSFLSGSSDACVGSGDIVGVERDHESSAIKKQGIKPNANRSLGELQDQHVEGGVAQSNKPHIKQLLNDLYVPRKYVELALATKNSEIEALKKQLIQSESGLAMMHVQNSLLTQELQNVKKRQRLSREETNHMVQDEFSVMVEQCKGADYSNRLCDLPDELLLHILSFLEVKVAAQTCLSCKRWGHMWALVPDLHFKESVLSKRPLFLDFVERAIALRGRSPMRAFSLNCEVEGAVVRIKKLIESVITCGVQELSLVFSNYKRTYLLPSSIFTCARLEMLEVESFCLLKLPSIYLPKLKVLILRNVTFEDNETLEKLFSSPSLEKLDYKEGWNGSISASSCARPCIRVTAPKLQHLSVNIIRPSRSIIEINGTHLKSFHYQGWFVDTNCILEDTNQLIEAFLWTNDNGYEGDRELDHVFKLLHLFSNVKEFTLFGSLLHVVSGRRNVPLFSNLIKLTLDWKFMINIRWLWIMLRISPRLRNLYFNKELRYYPEMGNYDQLVHPVPECFLTELRTISVRVLCDGELDRELFMVRVFLEKAMVLTEMVIQVPKQCECEHILLEKLSKFPMGSKNCRISLEQMP